MQVCWDIGNYCSGLSQEKKKDDVSLPNGKQDVALKVGNGACLFLTSVPLFLVP